MDEFSAVSRRLPIWQLYERARSLGLAVQVSAQSWHGLAPDEDERYRIAATADGGIWLLRTPLSRAGHRAGRNAQAGRHDPAAARRPPVEPSRAPPGSGRHPVADPALIRRLDVGQAAYIYRGGVTFIQVKRLLAAPAALARSPAPPFGRQASQVPAASQPEPSPSPAAAASAAAAPADGAEHPVSGPAAAAALLDEAFGPEPQ